MKAYDKDLDEVRTNLKSANRIISIAAAHLWLNTLYRNGHGWISAPLLTPKISDDFKQALLDADFVVYNSPTANQIKLVDSMNSGEWEFDLLRRDHTEHFPVLSLRVKVEISHRNRGVLFSPYVQSDKPSENPFSHFRIFEVAARHFKKIHTIVLRIVENGGEVIKYWEDLHWGGLRDLQKLFSEFLDGKSELKSMVASIASHFDPNPFAEGDLYLPERNQPALFRVWSYQLDDYMSQHPGT